MNANTNNQTGYENNQFDGQNLYNQDNQNIDNDNQRQYIENYQKSINNCFFDDLNSVGKWTISFIWIYFFSIFFLVIGITLWVEGSGWWYWWHNNNAMR